MILSRYLQAFRMPPLSCTRELLAGHSYTPTTGGVDVKGKARVHGDVHFGPQGIPQGAPR